MGTLVGVPDIYDAIIIGGGAAGLSAALVLGRCCRQTLLLDDGRPRNAVAAHMHGMLSRDGTPPAELLATARAQLHRYADFVRTMMEHVEAASVENGTFSVRASGGQTYRAHRLLLATGVVDAVPPIAGLLEAWGRTVFVCPYCDGWELRGRRIAAVGTGMKAVDLAQELRQWSTDLVVCAQGDDALSEAGRAWLQATNTDLRLPRISSVTSGDRPLTLEFEDGTRESCDAAFVSAPLRARHPLVDMLGCRLRTDGEIDVDNGGRTSVPGVYAAGDAVTTVHQVVLAAASGVCAAMAINEDRIKEQVRKETAGIERV